MMMMARNMVVIVMFIGLLIDVVVMYMMMMMIMIMTMIMIMIMIVMMIFFGNDNLMTSFPYSLFPPSLLFVSGCPSRSPNGVHSSGPTPQ